MSPLGKLAANMVAVSRIHQVDSSFVGFLRIASTLLVSETEERKPRLEVQRRIEERQRELLMRGFMEGAPPPRTGEANGKQQAGLGMKGPSFKLLIVAAAVFLTLVVLAAQIARGGV